MDNYTYKAFVCCGNGDIDRLVGEKVCGFLQTIKIQDGTGKKQRLQVYMDIDNPVYTGIDDDTYRGILGSEYLIVIGTPRLYSSVRSNNIINEFIKYGARERIILIQTEGEIPGGLSDVRIFDVRGYGEKDILSKLKSNVYPVLLSKFGKNQANITEGNPPEQTATDKHTVRAKNKCFNPVIVCAVIFLTVTTIVSSVMAFKLKKENDRLEERQDSEIENHKDDDNLGTLSDADENDGHQDNPDDGTEVIVSDNVIVKELSLTLANQAMALYDNGDTMGAISLAYQSLTEYNGIPMTYTAEGRYALATALRIYEKGGSAREASKILQTTGIVRDISVSPDGTMLSAVDNLNNLYVWDIASSELIFKGISDSLSDQDACTFVGNDKIAYKNADELWLYSFTDKTTIMSGKNYVENAYTGEDGKYIFTTSFDRVIIYNSEDMDIEQELIAPDDYTVHEDGFVTGDNYFVYSQYNTEEDEAGKNVITGNVKIVDMSTLEEICSIDTEYSIISDARTKDGKLYIALRNYASAQNEKGSMLACVDLSNGNILWKNESESSVAAKITLPYAEGATEMMVTKGPEIYLYDADTGERTQYYYMEDMVVSQFTTTKNNQFFVFLQNGSFHVIAVEEQYVLPCPHLFHAMTNSLKEMVVGDEYYIFSNNDDNRIILYGVEENPYVNEYSGVAGIHDESVLSPIQEAKKLGLNNSDMVSGILYSPEKDVVFVSYLNYCLEVYKVEDMTLLETVDGYVDIAVDYIGQDQEGNTYIAGDTIGICLDKDYKIIGAITLLAGMDVKENILIMDNSEERWTLPIFTMEDLLNRAKEVLQNGDIE